jgi:hypothetical protein
LAIFWNFKMLRGENLLFDEKRFLSSFLGAPWRGEAETVVDETFKFPGRDASADREADLIEKLD